MGQVVRFIAVYRIQIQDPVFFLLLIPRSGIRIRDRKNPGTDINIWKHISESLVRIFGLKILKFFVVDLNPGTGAFLTHGSGMEKSGQDSGSWINIPDPRHWFIS